VRPFAWLYPLKRWMYPDGRPNAVARTLNWISVQQFGRGLAPGTWVTLEVRGRRSGRVIRSPLVIVEHDGARYLVAMLGDATNWVRNLRAAGGRAVLRHGTAETVWLEEVPVAERPPILRRYLAAAPGARPHIPVSADASTQQLTDVAATLPTFRVRVLSVP
jgi:F420H(2)-dependent quinone reductase